MMDELANSPLSSHEAQHGAEFPPTLRALDATAARRWMHAAPALSPWLHEHVGAAMQQRLDWLRATPQRWCHWAAVRGGEQVHALLAARYPQAACEIVELTPHTLARAQRLWMPQRRWWQKILSSSTEHRGTGHTSEINLVPIEQLRPSGLGAKTPQPAANHPRADLLWANMSAHTAPDAQALLHAWYERLAIGGILMFSCLGPDTARELTQLSQAQGWGPAAAPLADMHDWGDALVHAGFAEPVMDTERITLTFPTPERLLQELRELGRNFHPARHAGLRTPRWQAQLLAAIAKHCRVRNDDDAGGEHFALTIEVIYGHAIRPEPRVAVQAQSAVSLADMRRMLQRGRAAP